MESVIYCPFGLSARLRVTGGDAAAFLQGQFTNDLRREGLGPVTYGLWLDNKGKTLADSFVIGLADGTFEVVSEFSPESVIRERLERYIIADDVKIEPVGGESASWIVAGEGADEWLVEAGLESPVTGRFAEKDGVRVFRTRATSQPAWRLVASGNEAIGFLETRFREAVKRGECAGCSADELAAARIRAGIPAVPSEIGSEDLPNEGGLEHEAISYDKGCYLGQEVMSRLHNLGRVRRRLFVVRWHGTGDAPPVAAVLFVDERKVGELRSLVRIGSDCVGMAMLQTHGVAPGDRISLEPNGSGELEVVSVAEGKAWV